MYFEYQEFDSDVVAVMPNFPPKTTFFVIDQHQLGSDFFDNKMEKVFLHVLPYSKLFLLF